MNAYVDAAMVFVVMTKKCRGDIMSPKVLDIYMRMINKFLLGFKHLKSVMKNSNIISKSNSFLGVMTLSNFSMILRTIWHTSNAFLIMTSKRLISNFHQK